MSAGITDCDPDGDCSPFERLDVLDQKPGPRTARVGTVIDQVFERAAAECRAAMAYDLDTTCYAIRIDAAPPFGLAWHGYEMKAARSPIYMCLVASSLF